MKIRVSNANETHDMELPVAISEVPVLPTHPAPLFAASPATLQAGSATTLSWNAAGASGLYLDGAGVTGPANTLITAPIDTTTYVFRAEYPGEPDVILTATVTVTPAPQPALHHLGVNVIHQCDEAKVLSGKGCRAFVVMDHPDVCEQIKAAHPDAVVVNRRWTTDPLNGQQWWDRFGASCGTGVINEIYNEADVFGYGNLAQIRQRIDNEMKFYEVARSRGALVAFGAFSVGTPEFADDNPNTKDIIEQCKRYAVKYNSDPGCYLTLHNYSPSMSHIDNDADLLWYERRWEFFFTRCGFDPTKRKIIVTETGVDEGGVGGFPAHKATAQQFVHWCDRYQQIIKRPVVVNGASYPSPVIASMIFCVTNGREWQGHDVSAWKAELAQVAGW